MNCLAIRFKIKRAVSPLLLKRFGSRGPSENVKMFPARSPRIRHRSELTERDWENAVQELGKDSSIQRL